MESIGPVSPGTVVNDPSYGGVAWSTPIKAAVSDNAYATAILPVGSASQYLKATNFNSAGAFDDIDDAAVINGFVAEVECSKTGSSSYIQGSARFVNADGQVVGNIKSLGDSLPVSDAYRSVGGAADTWGVAGLTGADMKNANSGIVVVVSNNDDFESGTARVDHIRLTVYFTNPVLSSPGIELRPSSAIRMLNSKLMRIRDVV